MRKRLNVKYPLFLSDVNETSILYTALRKKLKAPASDLKILPTAAELFHYDGLTEGHRHDEANSRF